MTRVHSFSFAVVLAIAAGLLPGCGAKVATVSGEVTYDGKPVEDGYITFTPSDGLGNDAGAPISNGRYTVTGLPPGPKVAKVIAVKKVSFASTSEEMKRRYEEEQKSGKHEGLVAPADVIPFNAEGNNAPVELAAGEQTRHFTLKPPAAN